MSDANKKAERMKKSQQDALEKILEELEEKFLSRGHIKARFLNGRTSANPDEIDFISKLDLIDSVRENAKTSLAFGDYIRAARWLVMLNVLCEKFL